jgi:hypothetical protein
MLDVVLRFVWCFLLLQVFARLQTILEHAFVSPSSPVVEEAQPDDLRLFKRMVEQPKLPGCRVPLNGRPTRMATVVRDTDWRIAFHLLRARVRTIKIEPERPHG